MIGQTLPATAILNTTLAEFRKNPFCPEYIIDTLIKRGYNTLSDIMDITEFDAMSIPSFGKGKVKKLMGLRKMLSSEKIADVEQFCHKHVDLSVVPSVDSSSLAEKITEVITVVANAFEANGKTELAMLCREYFLSNRTVSDIHSDPALNVGITRERLRQQTVWLRDAISNNWMMKYRMEIDDRFTAELSSTKAKVAGTAKSSLFEILGNGAPEHCFTNLFGLDVLSPDSYNVSAIDQEYLVDSEIGKGEMFKDIQAIVSALHDEVRPQVEDALFAKVSSERTNMSRDMFDKIIESHTMITRQEDGMLMLEYGSLRDYEKVARLVWENQEISLRDIDVENAAKVGESRSIAKSTHVAQRKFPWVKPMGKSGIWVYSDENTLFEQSLRSFVKEYVQNHDVFSFARALKDVAKAGYRYPEKTVRAYFMAECRVSNMNADVMCSIEKADSVKGVAWRKKTSDCTEEEFAELAVRLVREKGPMTRGALATAIREVEPTRMGNDATVWKWVDILAKEGQVLSIDANNMVSAVSNNIAKPVSVASKSLPCHYKAVLDEIARKLSEAPGKMCQLSELKKACSLIIRPYAQDTLFYKIVDNYRPRSIEKVYVNGNAYLHQVA